MLDKKFQIKRKHHYVWAHYLKNWSLDGLNVCYTTKKGKFSFDSVNGLAAERDFYKINLLDNDDLYFIKQFSKNSSEELQRLHNDFLRDFEIFSKAEKFAEFQKPPENVKQNLEAFKHNALENLHGSHEVDVIEILACLNKGELSVLEKLENRAKLKLFLGMQITRTKSFKKGIMEFNADSEFVEKGIDFQFTSDEFNNLMNKNWWFISYMFGINIGYYLNENHQEYNHVLLINKTSEPFITSDNPIINAHESVKGVGIPGKEAPEFTDFLYPLSPKYALMLNNSDRFAPGKVTITQDVAEELNIEIATKSDEYIFAQSEGQLRNLKKFKHRKT